MRVDLGGYGVGSGEEEEYGDRIGSDQEWGFQQLGMFYVTAALLIESSQLTQTHLLYHNTRG